MSLSLPVLITPTCITVVSEGRALMVQYTDKGRFLRVRKALQDKNYELAVDLLSNPEKISDVWSSGAFSIEDGVVYFKDPMYPQLDRVALPTVLSDRIYEMHAEGCSVQPFFAFYRLLNQNPSSRSVQEFYKFLEHKNFPIDEEGYVYAYKAVREDFYDIYSGKFLNAIGSVHAMPRNAVDDDKTRHCSKGFHVGSLQYVKWYGNTSSKYLICRFSPADVVSVPEDHSCQKVRVCRYEVVSEYNGPLPSTTIGNNSSEEEEFGSLNPEDDSWVGDFFDPEEDFDEDDIEDDIEDEDEDEVDTGNDPELEARLQSLLSGYSADEIYSVLRTLRV